MRNINLLYELNQGLIIKDHLLGKLVSVLFVILQSIFKIIIVTLKNRTMLLHLSPSRVISEFQEEFNQMYPYLKIEFYEKTGSGAGRIHLPHALTLKHAGLRHPGTIDLNNTMTVAEVEKKLKDEFSLTAQVCRKSGTLWLETTFTDNWTLGQQNEHGKELSETRSSTRNEDDIDLN